jgi:FixJ family two-component response regulator
MDRFVAGRYDLLVTDLRLPGHDGDVMARALRSVDPSMPTLLITG